MIETVMEAIRVKLEGVLKGEDLPVFVLFPEDRSELREGVYLEIQGIDREDEIDSGELDVRLLLEAHIIKGVTSKEDRLKAKSIGVKVIKALDRDDFGLTGAYLSRFEKQYDGYFEEETRQVEIQTIEFTLPMRIGTVDERFDESGEPVEAPEVAVEF